VSGHSALFLNLKGHLEPGHASVNSEHPCRRQLARSEFDMTRSALGASEGIHLGHGSHCSGVIVIEPALALP